MKSVQELIVLGKVPSDTVGADNAAGYPQGWPIFSDLSKQVQFDWDNLPSDRVRGLKNRPEYKAALESFLLAGSTPVEVSTEGPEVTLATSVEEELINAATLVTPPAAAAEVIPPAPVPPVTAVEEEPEGTRSGPYIKVKGGWQAVVESIDGSGRQVYTGKTKDEVSEKLIQAQAHATAKIRSQEEERKRMLADEPADLAPVRKRFTPRELTADEQFEFATAMASGDAVEINKAMSKRDFITLGGKPSEVLGEINRTQDELEFGSQMATAKSFMKQNNDVIFTKELGDAMDAILLEKGWAYTVRNLNKCLAMQKEAGKVQTRVSTPAVEVDLPIPTSAREATPASPVSVSTPPAAVVAPAPPVSRPPVATQTAERLRPGSASTGASPRQASVRQGSTPSSPVGLTVEEYNRMSVSETRRKYKTDLGFKTAVDKLMAEGKI